MNNDPPPTPTYQGHHYEQEYVVVLVVLAVLAVLAVLVVLVVVSVVLVVVVVVVLLEQELVVYRKRET